VLGGRFANGYRAIHHGVLVLDVQTVIQVHEAIVEGRPAIERTVALAGTGFARNIHLDARLGTPLEAIAKEYLAPGIESRIVINSPIRGEAVPDLGRPLDARIRLLAALPEGHRGQFMSFARPGFRADSYTPTFAANFLPLRKNLGTNLQGEERACISCGFCGDVCPARIMPQLLHRFVKRDVIDELILRYRIVDCIDCNLCTYVCPSKIPVAALIREGKARLAAEGLEDPTPPVPRGALKGV
jgi:Na(+)-translocating NADH:ubiquinone oxidoreductase A subunit